MAEAEKTSRAKTVKSAKSVKTKKSAPVQFEDDFNPPPLMEEPKYFGYEDMTGAAPIIEIEMLTDENILPTKKSRATRQADPRPPL